MHVPRAPMWMISCLVAGLAGVVSCSTPDVDCDDNETRVCVCAGGAAGAQTCTGGTWDACRCGGADDPDAGGTEPAEHHHGDLCVAPSFDCGATNLVCVVDNPDDTQGVCRAVCSSFADCLDDPEAHDAFDNDCCDVANGTQVCGQTNDWPSGACD